MTRIDSDPCYPFAEANPCYPWLFPTPPVSPDGYIG
jgi:hypothetical protein